MEHLQCFLCEEFATGPKLEMCVSACFFVSLLVSWLVNQSVSEFSQLVSFFVGLADFFHQPKKAIKKKPPKNHRESPGRFECRNLYEVAAEMPGILGGGGSCCHPEATAVAKFKGSLSHSKGSWGKLWHVCRPWGSEWGISEANGGSLLLLCFRPLSCCDLRRNNIFGYLRGLDSIQESRIWTSQNDNPSDGLVPEDRSCL